jgi:hypothetical protein
LVGMEKIVHLSGCPKGCAHSKPAAVTIVGPDHWLLNGRAGDTPQGTISPAGLVSTVKRLCAEDHRSSPGSRDELTGQARFGQECGHQP